MGAGAEVGSYIKSVIPCHWSALVPWIELQMKLYLYYSKNMPYLSNKERNNYLIGRYEPTKPQWWITIFNPQYQDDIGPEHLHLKCIIKFDALRFAAIYSEARNGPDKDKYKKYWTFNNITKTAVLRF